MFTWILYHNSSPVGRRNLKEKRRKIPLRKRLDETPLNKLQIHCERQDPDNPSIHSLLFYFSQITQKLQAEIDIR